MSSLTILLHYLPTYSKQHFWLLTMMLLAYSAGAQNQGKRAEAFYLQKMAKADSLYDIGEYGTAAQLYTEVTLMFLSEEQDVAKAHAKAASAWSLAGHKDKAFAQLSLLLDYEDYDAYQDLSKNESFAPLHNDERWSVVILRAQKNRGDSYGFIPPAQTPAESTVFSPFGSEVENILESGKRPLTSKQQGRFRMYYDEGSYGDNYLERLYTELEFAYNRVLRVLEIEKYDRGIYIILAPSEKEMDRMSGEKGLKGKTMAGNNCALLLASPKQGQLHLGYYLFQLLASQALGDTEAATLQLGGGIYAQNNCTETNPRAHYQVASYLASKNQLLSFKELEEAASAQNSTPSVAIQCAALYQYLYETYGMEKLRMLWVKDFGCFDGLFQMSLEDFETEWKEHLKSLELPEGVDYEKILKQGC